MDPFEPIAGVSLEQYAEVSAQVALAKGNPVKVGEALGKTGVSAESWERANAAWSVRLADPLMGVRLADSFEARYHDKLTELLGPPPDVPPEDFAAMLGEAMVAGLPAMGKLRGVDPLTWSRISYSARKAGMSEPKAFSACLALAAQIAERRLAGLVGPNATGASGGAAVEKTFEKDAAVAAKAVGKAFLSGLDAFGSAMDGLGKSIMGPSVGARVMVQWSDGKKYPGTVAEIGKNQIRVTMTDGSQHWVPEAYVQAI